QAEAKVGAAAVGQAEVKTISASELATIKTEKLVSIAGLETLSKWVEKYKKVNNYKEVYEKSAITYDIFWNYLKKLTEIQYAPLYAQKVTNSEADKMFFFYAEGRTIPNNSIIYIWGDIHGDIKSFVAMMD